MLLDFFNLLILLYFYFVNFTEEIITREWRK